MTPITTIFRRLLLATEHTEFDQGAETVAIEMARHCGLPLATVMPLISNPEYESVAPEIAARAEKEAARKIDELRKQASAQGVSIDLRLRRGEEPYLEIVQEAKDLASDLIIIRRRGKKGFFANLLVGEMVSKVVAHAPCNILIAPRGAQMWKAGILVAAEPGDTGMQLVKIAAAVASQCKLPLNIVSVVTASQLRNQAEAFLRQVTATAQASGVQTQTHIAVGNAVEQIQAVAERTQSDLIVIASRSDTHIGRAMVGGVAQKVIGLSENPVLVLNPLR